MQVIIGYFLARLDEISKVSKNLKYDLNK